MRAGAALPHPTAVPERCQSGESKGVRRSDRRAGAGSDSKSREGSVGLAAKKRAGLRRYFQAAVDFRAMNSGGVISSVQGSDGKD